MTVTQLLREMPAEEFAGWIMHDALSHEERETEREENEKKRERAERQAKRAAEGDEDDD